LGADFAKRGLNADDRIVWAFVHRTGAALKTQRAEAQTRPIWAATGRTRGAV